MEKTENGRQQITRRFFSEAALRMSSDANESYANYHNFSIQLRERSAGNLQQFKSTLPIFWAKVKGRKFLIFHMTDRKVHKMPSHPLTELNVPRKCFFFRRGELL